MSAIGHHTAERILVAGMHDAHLGYTHNINTPVSCNSDDGVEGTEIDTDDTHICFSFFSPGL